MIDLGRFTSKSNKTYHGQYFPETRMVCAVGPIVDIGSAGPVFETEAESDEDAIKQIESAMENGIIE